VKGKREMMNRQKFVLLKESIGRVCLISAIIILSAGYCPAQQGEPIRVLRDLEYNRINGTSLLLDLYLPVNAKGPLPVIVWIHGGGWRAGSKNLASNGIQVRQASRGYAVASINYRLSDVAKHPAQVEDCKAAIRWLSANAVQYNLDTGHIGVWGSSAGGHLVAMLGTSGGVDSLEGSSGNLDQSSRVQAVVDWYGPTDLLKISSQALPCSRLDHDSPDSPESLLLGCTLQTCPERAVTANPITYITPEDPPFLIMHGTNDCTVPPGQSQLLFDALKEAGVEATLQFLQGAGHGGPEFSSPESEQLITSFFDKHLRSAPNLLINGATFKKPVLTINGSGFGSSGANVSVNGKDVSSLITDQTGSQITLKGNKKKLGLRKGPNQIAVTAAGATSNTFTLNLLR
jgi:acetyl esterase/lipase